jgi:hypothetical protein
VPGIGAVDRARYEWRDVFRADGSIVSVMEDNKGNDKMEYGGTITASGQLVGFQTDHLDDDGFWSSVGSWIENNLGSIVETLGSAILTAVTAGSASPLLWAVVDAGGANLVGQAVDMVAEGRSFSLSSLAGSLAGGAVSGEFADLAGGGNFTVAGNEVLGGMVKAVSVSAAQSLASNGVSALTGGQFNLNSVLSGMAGAAASGALQGWNLFDLPPKDGPLGLKALNDALNGMAQSAASQGVNIAMKGGHVDWVAVLGKGAINAGGTLAAAGAAQVKGLFQMPAPTVGSGPPPTGTTDGTGMGQPTASSAAVAVTLAGNDGKTESITLDPDAAPVAGTGRVLITIKGADGESTTLVADSNVAVQALAQFQVPPTPLSGGAQGAGEGIKVLVQAGMAAVGATALFESAVALAPFVEALGMSTLTFLASPAGRDLVSFLATQIPGGPSLPGGGSWFSSFPGQAALSNSWSFISSELGGALNAGPTAPVNPGQCANPYFWSQAYSNLGQLLKK